MNGSIIKIRISATSLLHWQFKLGQKVNIDKTIYLFMISYDAGKSLNKPHLFYDMLLFFPKNIRIL